MSATDELAVDNNLLALNTSTQSGESEGINDGGSNSGDGSSQSAANSNGDGDGDGDKVSEGEQSGTVDCKLQNNNDSNKEKCINELQDACYTFAEQPLQPVDGALYYTPSYFLRTHSKNNNNADVQTQIWQCCFAPSVALGSTIHSNVVATCGGSSVCFIDVVTGEVLLKYNRSNKALVSENLYALAWSSLEVVEEDDEGGVPREERNSGDEVRASIVAAGGGKSTVVLVDVEAGFCYHMFRTVPSKNTATICSLLFHPKKQNWLFCGHEDGHIDVWDVGVLSRPSYSATQCYHVAALPAVAGDAYNLQFSHTHDLLIAGCDSALVLYHIDLEKIAAKEKVHVTKVELPSPFTNEDGRSSSSVVDSIVLVRDGILAAKGALHARTYVFSVQLLLDLRQPTALKGVDSYLQLTLDDVVSLEFSDTDNYYMNMGADSRSCVLVCGDDKGTLWLYDLYDLVTGKQPSPLTGGPPLPAAIPPHSKLLWPDLDDPEVEKAGKLRLDSYDIVVDKCCVSEGAEHVVAVTSNNMVCIWARDQPADDRSDA